MSAAGGSAVIVQVRPPVTFYFELAAACVKISRIPETAVAGGGGRLLIARLRWRGVNTVAADAGESNSRCGWQ
eukprot:scaffold426680_cov31-Prasinocladus_malaysianus.AAC.4